MQYSDIEVHSKGKLHFNPNCVVFWWSLLGTTTLKIICCQNRYSRSGVSYQVPICRFLRSVATTRESLYEPTRIKRSQSSSKAIELSTWSPFLWLGSATGQLKYCPLGDVTTVKNSRPDVQSIRGLQIINQSACIDPLVHPDHPISFLLLWQYADLLMSLSLATAGVRSDKQRSH